MIMHKEIYRDFILRFAKELDDVGVTEDMHKIVEAQYTRTPNVGACEANENVKKFCYRHEGYEIEAVQNIKLMVRKCK
jgi:hypothetical protein|tara:strand:+ start:2122 stop:2355 length:234 start_codon:yes stop_codon:yes gene_type:complete